MNTNPDFKHRLQGGEWYVQNLCIHLGLATSRSEVKRFGHQFCIAVDGRSVSAFDIVYLIPGKSVVVTVAGKTEVAEVITPELHRNKTSEN